MFSIHDLAAFVAVADGGSIRQAASQLARTQPAITQAVQRLEQALGFELLDRSNYRSTLSERGALFLKRARALTLQAKDLKTYAGVLSHGNEAVLRISVHGALPPDAWMPLIAPVAEFFPDTVIELRCEEGHAPLRHLMEGQVDLAIAVSSPLDAFGLDVSRQLIGEVDFINVVRKDRIQKDLENGLAAIPQILVSDFDDPETLLGVAQGHRYWRVSDHRAKVAAIIAGAGWGTVPAWMITPMLENGKLQQICYRGIGPKSRHSFFVYHKREIPLGPVASYIWNRGALL
jgi:DNA-binding transcriptional LysR family regulator